MLGMPASVLGELDDLDKPPVGGILGQVDRRAHAQRQYDQQCQYNDIQCVEDGRQDAVGLFNTLAVVERNFQLMWGMPRTSTMPMIPATRTITRTALAQTSAVMTRFHI